jgi:hypothetical protein
MQFASGYAPRLSFFPQDGMPWRIDWFGDVAFPDRREGHKQPAMCLAISRVNKDTFDRFHCNRSVLKQRQIWAPVGLLPNFRLGDIWQDGFLLQREVTPATTFQSLNINRRSCRMAKAGIDVNGQGFLLPASEHPWHMRHTHSYCLVVKLKEDHQLVIPCAELIRFYFGSSSSLLATLFTPPLNRKRLYSDAHFRSDSGRLHLKLAKGISGYSAADIGRLHLDRHAWAAASEIGLSLLEGTTRNAKAYPRTRFPFVGETTLVAVGEWLSLGDQADRSFLVHSIQSCSHQFPFRTLAYDMMRVSPFERSRRQPQGIQTPPPASQFAGITRSPSVVHQDPSKHFSPSSWYVWQGVKFPDLEAKSVFKRSTLIERIPAPAANHRRSSVVDTWAISEPTGTRRPVRPLALELPQQIQAIDTAPDFLQEPLSKLVSIPEVSITLMTASHQDGWSLAINAMQDDSRAIDSRLYLRDGHIKRIRRACIVHVEDRNGSLGLLVLLEATPTQAYLLTEFPANEEGVSLALETSAIKFLTKRRSLTSGTIQQLRQIVRKRRQK